MPQWLGLIAGEGDLPLEVARAARAGGRRVHAVAFRDLTRKALEREVDRLEWLHLGQLGALLATFRRAGVGEAVLVGKVAKTHLYAGSRSLRPDARAIELLKGLADRRDDSILRALADWLESEGIALRPQGEWVPHLLAGEGCLGAALPSAEQMADVAFAWPIAKGVAGQDIGQCVVVKRGAVLAVEAIEGTDAAVRRGGALAGGGACVVKVAKPCQDLRFDVPTVGPRTLQSLVAVGARLLAVEAGRTLLLGRAELVERADAHGIVLLGVDGQSLTDGRPEGP